MHDLVAAQNSIGGASLDAQRATNAPSLIDDGHSHGAFKAMFNIQGQGRPACDARQDGHAFCATWRTLIDRNLFFCNGLRIGLTVWVAAPSALRLGQRIMDAVGQGVHFLRAGAFLATTLTVFLAGALLAGLALALTAVLLAAFLGVPVPLCAKMNLTTSG